MKTKQRSVIAAVLVVLVLAATNGCAQQADQLPSWNDGPTKSAIIQFVQDVTKESGPKFVPPEQRIATFDNDGTLWVEQPVVQFEFAIHRIKAMAGDHPEWKELSRINLCWQGTCNVSLKI